MKFALINPNWTFDGGIYFGCREPHLPLEFGYSRALLQQQGHEVLLLNAHQHKLTHDQIHSLLLQFMPDFTVVATANSYLFWRCAQPELSVPAKLMKSIRDVAGFRIAVGPHGSSTPTAALAKLDADAVVLGECEEVLPLFAMHSRMKEINDICYMKNGKPRIQGSPHSSSMDALPPLQWEAGEIQAHTHHHHRFDQEPSGAGAEMEVSRGCPYHCTFCAKENFRNRYRKRPIPVILEELDALMKNGVEYVYFIDEIFLPDRDLLRAFASRDFVFGMQTRIDLWSEEFLTQLGRAGCVSIEAGIESITEDGRADLDKNCRLSTEQLTRRLLFARQQVPFVQANLLESEEDDVETIEKWRDQLIRNDVWANKPVPLFPYPGSTEYFRKWGAPDESAWERAQNYYLKAFKNFSDIQQQHPLSLEELESV